MNMPGSGDITPLALPSRFVLQPVRDGNYAQFSPTIYAIYIGCQNVPSFEVLSSTVAIVFDHPTSRRFELFGYCTNPEIDEALSDGTNWSLHLEGPEDIINSFFQSVEKIKKVTLIFALDTHHVSWTVNTDTCEVLHHEFVERHLH